MSKLQFIADQIRHTKKKIKKWRDANKRKNANRRVK